MTRKIIDNLLYVGFAGLFGGYIYYSVSNQWDWRAQVAVYAGAALVIAYVAFNFGRVRTALSGRTGKYGTTAFTVAILVIGILVLLNFLNFRHHKRIDLSANKQFELSDQTQKVLKNLQQPIQIIGFYQDEQGATQFQSLMKEYRYVSSKVETRVVDPQKDPGSVQQYNVQRNGQVVLVNGPKIETIDQADEEKLTNAIIKITRKGEKTVYFLTGHGEKGISDTGPRGFSAVKDAVTKQNYVVKEYNLAQENKVPDDATVLVAAGPKIDFFPNEVDLLKKYMEGGGKFLLLVDPDSEFKMPDFLATYGVSLTGKTVIDASGVGQVFGLGFTVPLVASYGEHPITKELNNVMSFFPMAENIKQVSSSGGYQTSRLFSTSSRSWAEAMLESGKVPEFDEKQDERGPLDLGVAASKSVSSTGTADNAGKQQSKESRMVIIGDSDFASNGYARGAANLDVMLNSVSWLAEDADLIAVRPKEPENRMVNLSFQQSKLIFWGTVILLPLATLFAGIGVWWRRR
ncbi:MAG: GldG family protein [Acidobacteriota bacterium]